MRNSLCQVSTDVVAWSQIQTQAEMDIRPEIDGESIERGLKNKKITTNNTAHEGKVYVMWSKSLRPLGRSGKQNLF